MHCGAEYEPDPFRLCCDLDHPPSLLRTVYNAKQITVRPELPGLFRFMDWLPVQRYLQGVGKPITYESQGLAHHLKLDQLLISFNGYWPDRQAQLRTCSFKELEALTVLASIPTNHPRTLVIASAGNTGRAFAHICSQQQIPLCLVIPESNRSAIWSTQPFSHNVCLITVSEGGDYTDAISLANLISQMPQFFPEGGAANVARRDGMGLTVLDAAVTLGRIPDHYFQAVGSGAGGIAAWETSLRLLEDGRFGTKRMKLHLAQNSPFIPMVDAWKAGDRDIAQMPENVAKKQINQVAAQVLTNRRPAYSLAGGLYDALMDTNGEMYAVTNRDAEQAMALFQTLEGIDIGYAAGVATAALIQAVQTGNVKRQDTVLLNITCGGSQQMQQDNPLHHAQPDLVFSPEQIKPDWVAKRLEDHRTVSTVR